MTGKFRSKFESKVNDILSETSLNFTYEETTVTLMDAFDFEQDSYQKWGKKYKNVKRVRAMTYTPDFVVEDKYIIEVKGFRTPSFNIKWKLFKNYIIENELDWHIYLVHSQKQLREVIERIEELVKTENNETI